MLSLLRSRLSGCHATLPRKKISRETVPENRTAAVIGSNRERNVVRMWAAVSFGGALRDIRKDGCEGDYPMLGFGRSASSVNCVSQGTVARSYQFTSRFRIQEPEPHLLCWYGSKFYFLLKLWNMKWLLPPRLEYTAIKQTCHISNNLQSTEYTMVVQDKNTTKRTLIRKTNHRTLDVENRRILKKAQITTETSNSF